MTSSANSEGTMFSRPSATVPSREWVWQSLPREHAAASKRANRRPRNASEAIRTSNGRQDKPIGANVHAPTSSAPAKARSANAYSLHVIPAKAGSQNHRPSLFDKAVDHQVSQY